MNVHDLKSDFHIAMHAMGSYHKLRYTNSREAFLSWYAKGIRVFEVDLAEAEDGQFVCITHHMAYRDLKRVGISVVPDHLTSEWFLHQKLFPYMRNGLTPLSLKDLIDLLKQYVDVILMLDLFGQFESRILENFSRCLNHFVEGDTSVINRLLIETYNEEMTAVFLKQIPGVHIIYGIDDLAAGVGNAAVSIGRMKEIGIEFVSFPWHYTVKYPGRLKELVENGLTVFSKTMDNRKEDTLRNAGVRVLLLDRYYETTKGLAYIYIYIQGRIMAGILFVQHVFAKLLDCFHGVKKENRRKRA